MHIYRGEALLNIPWSKCWAAKSVEASNIKFAPTGNSTSLSTPDSTECVEPLTIIGPSSTIAGMSTSCCPSVGAVLEGGVILVAPLTTGFISDRFGFGFRSNARGTAGTIGTAGTGLMLLLCMGFEGANSALTDEVSVCGGILNEGLQVQPGNGWTVRISCIGCVESTIDITDTLYHTRSRVPTAPKR